MECGNSCTGEAVRKKDVAPEVQWAEEGVAVVM